jgi:hypothetical protein
MVINETLACVWVQNLHIASLIITKEEQLTKINLGFEKKL